MNTVPEAFRIWLAIHGLAIMRTLTYEEISDIYPRKTDENQ